MEWVFGLFLLLGMLALIALVTVEAVRSEGPTPRTRRLMRQGVAGAVAFGMGGLSAAYAGWPLGWATLAAASVGVLAAWYARAIGHYGGEGSS